MSDDWDDVHWQDATPVEETMISSILAQRKRIDEYEQALANMQREYDKRGDRIRELEDELAGAINVAYGVSEAAGKRRGELEVKLAVAVDALEDVNTFGDCGLQHIVRPALAKIKSQGDEFATQKGDQP